MIGKLKGKLVEVEKNIGLIETSGGVFYRVFLPPHLIQLHPTPYTLHPIEIYTFLQVRDDALVLFGFETKAEYDFFVLLLTVSGVGPKTAFNVISFSNTEEVICAVKNNDVNYFTKVPGLGKKTAMKIILELSQKLKEEFKFEKMYLSSDDQTVVDGLVSLGFSVGDVRNIFQKLDSKLSVEEKIKKGLKLLSK